MKGKSIKKWLLLGILGVALGLGMVRPVCSKAATIYLGKLETTTEGTKYKYYDSSGSAKYVIDDFRRVNNTKYYFNKKGIMKKKAWISYGGQWYYADATGAIVTGWKTIGTEEYYFYPSGKMAYNTTISNKYVVDSEGRYVGTVGSWISENGKKKYIKYTGEIARAEICTIGTSKYYFDNDEFMKTGWISIKNNGNQEWYYAGSDGKLVTGWQTIKGAQYYFYTTGKLAQNTNVWGRYAVDSEGIKQTTVGKWKKADEKHWYYDMPGRYYHPSSRSYTTDLRPRNTIYWINGQKYFFDENGYMITGWLDVNKFIGLTYKGPSWVYIKSDGTFYPMGWHKVGNRSYYFVDNEGTIATNTTIGKYTFDSDGVYTTKSNSTYGWKQKDGKWRYQLSNGTYYASCIITIDSRTYAFDSEGYLMSGWVNKNTMADTSAESSVWYYFDEKDLAGVNGWMTLDGATYYFRQGLMAHDEFVEGRYLGHNGKCTSVTPTYVDSRITSIY